MVGTNPNRNECGLCGLVVGSRLGCWALAHRALCLGAKRLALSGESALVAHMDKGQVAGAPELMKEALVAVFIKRLLDRRRVQGATREELHK